MDPERLLREGRYLELLELAARDELLARLLRSAPGALETLFFLAAWRHPEARGKLLELARRLGVDPKYVEVAAAIASGRLEELVKVPRLRLYGLVASGRATPEQALQVIRDAMRVSRLFAQVLAAKYIQRALERGVRPRDLVKVAEAVGLEEVARALRAGEEAAAAVAEAIREQLPKLLEKGLVKIPGLSEAYELAREALRLAEEARRVAEEAERRGTPEAYAEAARRLHEIYKKLEELARRGEKLGVKIGFEDVAGAAVGSAVAAVLLAGVREGLRGVQRILPVVKPVLSELAPRMMARLEEAVRLAAKPIGVGEAIQILKCLFPGYRFATVGGPGRPARLEVR